MYIYVVYESGIHADEWWLVETFETEFGARKYIEEVIDEEDSTRYRILRCIKEKVIFEN